MIATAYGMWNLVALLAFAAFSESAVALPATASSSQGGLNTTPVFSSVFAVLADGAGAVSVCARQSVALIKTTSG